MNNTNVSFVIIPILIMVFGSCHTNTKKSPKEVPTSNIPKNRNEIQIFPNKENIWIYVMAGQSNMAGRATIEARDTVSNNRIMSMSKDMLWYEAKEPLHFYESKRAGLDCGKSFAEALLTSIPDSIHIGLIPCAVGGSSIDNWLSDKEFRKVKLLSNFEDRIKISQKTGIIKGILWHQGESDTKAERIAGYQTKLIQLHQKFENIIQNDSLPILVAPITYFGNPDNEEESLRWKQINTAISAYTKEHTNVYMIKTDDFMHNGDSLHYDSNSQRLMGKRFAEKILELSAY